jgi:hypothetical protein
MVEVFLLLSDDGKIMNREIIKEISNEINRLKEK